jgi:dTDP-4-dehydrorhamnose reductase
MATILLLGSKGWIGQQLKTIIHARNDVKTVYESFIRIDDVERLQNIIDALQPTHIISTIGRTHGVIDGVKIPTIDYLEYDGKLRENIRDNLYCPIVLTKLCSDRNIHLTYLGTGCIFEYDTVHSNGFGEDSTPNFFGSSYSTVKGFTDQLMKLYSDKVLNVRIRMPITSEPNPRDFITKIVGYEKICSIPNSMSVLDELLPIMVDMAINKKVGTINLTNPGTISHQEVLEMYREIIDPTKVWSIMSYEEQNNLLLSKRSNNALDTSKLQLLYPNVSHIKTAIYNALNNRKKLIK